jgi:DnaJ-class molecular chaperone
MTRAEARQILSGTLVFGDIKQISAVRFLQRLEELGACESCDGSGECQCHCGDNHDCAVCDGSGLRE